MLNNVNRIRFTRLVAAQVLGAGLIVSGLLGFAGPANAATADTGISANHPRADVHVTDSAVTNDVHQTNDVHHERSSTAAPSDRSGLADSGRAGDNR